MPRRSKIAALARLALSWSMRAVWSSPPDASAMRELIARTVLWKLSRVPNYLGAAAISPDATQAWVPSKQDNIKRGTLRVVPE